MSLTFALLADPQLAESYVGITLAIPVFLTALVALGCALLFVFAGTLGASLDDRVTITVTVSLLAAALWSLSALVKRFVLSILPPGPVVSLRDIVRRDLTQAEVGAKAYHLAHFGALGAPTAPGWVLRGPCFERAIRRAGFGSPSSLSEATIDKIRVPRRALKRAHTALESTNSQRFVVRSSFGGEDTPDAAAPGIYASVTWTRDEGLEGLEAAILRVWRSYFTAQATAYRASCQSPPSVRLSVLMQPECPHERMGVVASADVVFERRDRHLVDVLDSDSPWSGTHDLLIDNVMGCPGSDPISSLDETIVRRLSQLAGAAEQLLGASAEVEWGLHQGRITAYQARAISGSTLARTVTNAHLAELPGYPMTPLSKSFLFDGQSPLELLRKPMRRLGLGELPDEAMVEIHGRHYLDITPFKSLILGSPGGQSLGLKGLWSLLRRSATKQSSIPDVAPSPPDEAAPVRRLVAELRQLQRAELQPKVLEQGRALLLAGVVEGLLVRLTNGEVPPPRIGRPVVGEAWFHADELAELASPRAGESGRLLDPELNQQAVLEGAPRSGDRLVNYLARKRDALLTTREVLNAEIAIINFRARQLALALDERLGEQGQGWRMDDVFYATLEELEAIVRSEPEVALPPEARKKRREQLKADRLEAPLPIVIVEEDGTFHPPQAPLGREGALLVGLGVGVGSADGPLLRLRAELGVAVDDVAGHIVVLEDSSPKWSAHVLAAAGVVLTRGGPLSHLALLCRERGIPAIASARGEIEHLQDGAIVQIDAQSGSLQGENPSLTDDSVSQGEGADLDSPASSRDD